MFAPSGSGFNCRACLGDNLIKIIKINADINDIQSYGNGCVNNLQPQTPQTPQVSTCGYMNQTPNGGYFTSPAHPVFEVSPSRSLLPLWQIFTNYAKGLDMMRFSSDERGFFRDKKLRG